MGWMGAIRPSGAKGNAVVLTTALGSNLGLSASTLLPNVVPLQVGLASSCQPGCPWTFLHPTRLVLPPS